MLRYAATALLTTALWAGAVLPAQAQDQGAQQTVLLVLRVLAYDQNLTKRVQDDGVHLVIVKGPGDCGGLPEAFTTAAQTIGLSGNPLLVDPLTEETTPEDVVAKAKSGGVFLCPDVRSAEPYISPAEAAGTLMITTWEHQVREGAAIGVVETDGRRSLFVNHPASKRQGAALDAGVLRIATVIR